MTNEEAVTYGNELIQCSTGPLREFAELATRALRSPAPGAVAMREACLNAVRKCNVIGSRGSADGWFGGVLAALEQVEADIRALPAPEVPEVIQTWCKNYDATEDCGGLDWARNSRLRDYYRKEYPDACK